MASTYFDVYTKQCDAYNKIMSVIKDLENMAKMPHCQKEDLLLSQDVTDKLRDAATVFTRRR